MSKLLLPLMACILTTACAMQGEYPSLAKRPIEKGEPVSTLPAPPPTPSDPALVSRINAAVKKAKDAVPGFDAAVPAAEAAARRGASASRGSEAWIAGQIGVSALERNVVAAREAASALDDELQTIQANPTSPDRAALEAAIAEVEAIDTRQTGIVRSLLAMLK